MVEVNSVQELKTAMDSKEPEITLANQELYDHWVSRSKRRKLALFIFLIIFLLSGSYFLLVSFHPEVRTAVIKLYALTKDKAHPSEHKNLITIPKKIVPPDRLKEGTGGILPEQADKTFTLFLHLSGIMAGFAFLLIIVLIATHKGYNLEVEGHGWKLKLSKP
jgi:hypothetical protein